MTDSLHSLDRLDSLDRFDNPTIAAISTPLAPGGIGVVRISGPQAFDVVAGVFAPVSSQSDSGSAGSDSVTSGLVTSGLVTGYKGYTVHYGRVFERIEGERIDIDECVATFFRAPRSYTGEDVVELSCHGGPILLQRLLRAALAAGAQPAGPGEFTRRAMMNGKLSLTQAEAVMDLIQAKSVQASRAALQLRDGGLYREISAVIGELVKLAGHLAAWVDFPEEDVEELSTHRLLAGLVEQKDRLDRLIRGYDGGQLLREGVTAVIVGRPNVGKSTLMNLLARSERSIVTDIPGTTRDVVEEPLLVDGILLRLADTAGLRDTSDPVESVGVELARRRMEGSQIVLAVFDLSRPLEQEDVTLMDSLRDRPALAVFNKGDLPRCLDGDRLKAGFSHWVELSARQPDGRERLEQALTQLLRQRLGTGEIDPSAPMLANERQLQQAVKGSQALGEAADALAAGVTLDAVSVCVDQALAALMELTGEKVSDRVIDQVFAAFCVGK